LQNSLRIPTALGLFKAALPQVFPGLAVGDDLSNRSGVGSASTIYSIWYDPTTRKIRRSSAADGYLWAPSQQRASLTVLATHKVNKVLFGKDASAKGVSFVPTDSGSSSNKAFDAYASKGVILSAGSLASAPILERSGVGNPEVLQKAGVKCLVKLPGVGTNLNASHLGDVGGEICWADFWDRTSRGPLHTL
jgi:choline dehydrogenase